MRLCYKISADCKYMRIFLSSEKRKVADGGRRHLCTIHRWTARYLTVKEGPVSSNIQVVKFFINVRSQVCERNVAMRNRVSKLVGTALWLFFVALRWIKLQASSVSSRFYDKYSWAL